MNKNNNSKIHVMDKNDKKSDKKLNVTTTKSNEERKLC